MISKTMATRLNAQVNHEFANERSYLATGYWFESNNLKVFAKFFFKQALEERSHATKIAQFLIDVGAYVKLDGVAPETTAFSSARAAVEAFVNTEITTTKLVYEIVDMAIKENDHSTREFIGWKVTEQVEEVALANELLGMVKLAEAPGQLLMLEGRVYQLMERS